MTRPRAIVLLTALAGVWLQMAPASTARSVQGTRGGAKPPTAVDGGSASHPRSHVKAASLGGVADPWVAIAPRRAVEALEPLARHREARSGASAAIVCLEDLTALAPESSRPAEASGGRSRVKSGVREAVAAFARASRARGGARFLFLVGSDDEIPAGRVLAGGLTRLACLSDVVYACDDDDPLPDGAVGRFPNSEPERVRSYVERIDKYESFDEPAGWRRRIAFLAGSGGFGVAVDGAIDAAVSGLLDREMPPELDLRVLRPDPASAFGVPSDKEVETIRDLWNGGALVFLYAGHGSRHGLHTATGLGITRTIFTSARAKQLDIRGGSPFVMIFACNTAEFAPVKRPAGEAGEARAGAESRGELTPSCLAEALLVNPRGAIAVLGASEVSHPYPDLLLAHEFNELFRANPKTPLGELVTQAKRRMSTETGEFRKNVDQIAGMFGLPETERRLLVEHEQSLYQYLGDPAIVLRVPDVKLDVRGPATVKPGEAFEFRVEAKGLDGARVVARLEATRGAAPREKGHPAANARVLDQLTGAIEGTEFRGQFTAPVRPAFRRLVVSVDVLEGSPGAAGDGGTGRRRVFGSGACVLDVAR